MLGRPRATLAVVALVTGLLSPAALRVRVDSAVDRLLPVGDPARAHLERVQAAFGSDEVVVVALFADDVLAPATLGRIARLTEAIADLDFVREVVSLANLEHVRIGPDGLGRERVLPPPPWSPGVRSGVRAALRAHPLVHGGIASADGDAAGIVARLEPMSDDILLATDVMGRLEAAVASHPGPEAVALTGLPVLKVRAAQAMVRDVALFFVLGLLVIGAVLAGAFRSVRGVALPLGAVSIGLVWTSATMTMAGDAFTLGTLVLPPLLLSVGIAYAIHVMSRYELERTLGGTADTVVRRTLRHVRVPIVMAALTTLAGFAAFLGNPIPTIRDFGWYAIVGLACVLAATLTALPAALVLARTTAGPPPAGASRWIDPLVLACTRVALGHPRAVILWAGAITVVAALGIGRIDVETDYLRFFAPEHPARRDNARVANKLVGTQLVAVTVNGERPEALTRLDALTALADLVAFVGAQPGVGHVTSYLDHLRMLRQAVEPEHADTPLRDQRAVDQRMALLNPESMRRVLDAEHSEGQVVVYTRLSGSGEIRALVRRIEDWAAAHLPASIDARASGTLVLLTDSADTLARQQVAGLGQVLVVLTLLLAGLFRSLRLGLLAMVPNVFPVVVLFGIMGWTGIDLDVSTSMIACIAIGIAVDDTIHYVTTYEARRGREEDAATMIEHTVRTVGRPIVLTSVALGLGFLVPCLSTFQPVRHFGVLASATMVVALLADLLLLPALLVSWRVPARGARP